MWDKKGENISYNWFYKLKEVLLNEQEEKQFTGDRESTEALAALSDEQLVKYATARANKCNSMGNVSLGNKDKEKVTIIQKALKNAGANITDPEGTFGPTTLVATIAAQKQTGIRTDGCVGPETVQALKIPVKTAPQVQKKVFTSGDLSKIAIENNQKYFGNPQGMPGQGWQSSLTSKRRYNRGLNFTLGAIPYRGSTGGRGQAKVNPQWIRDNIIRVSSPVGRYRINKHIAESLASAIEESRAEYGLPMRNIGGFVVKGTDSGFSSHTWGAGIDFDHWVNPFSPGGLLSPRLVSLARKGGKGTKRYWNLKNPAGQTWKEYLDSLGDGESAMPLYFFVAGRPGDNGIAKIFRKHGWKWGGDYRGKKDSMHFEYLG